MNDLNLPLLVTKSLPGGSLGALLVDSTGRIVAKMEPDDGNDEKAESIALAVNCHNELVESCKRLLWCVGIYRDREPGTLQKSDSDETVRLSKVAINHATGEEWGHAELAVSVNQELVQVCQALLDYTYNTSAPSTAIRQRARAALDKAKGIK